jgi:hypothetical protein
MHVCNMRAPLRPSAALTLTPDSCQPILIMHGKIESVVPARRDFDDSLNPNGDL